ncbi:MAG: S41 family peptidase [Planctomycetota bacterium]
MSRHWFRHWIHLVLLAAPLALLASPAAAKPTLGLRYGSLTPDGKRVVFGYRGDIWVASTDGKGSARRLTIHEQQDTMPRVSPDGKQVAFASKRNGGYDIYVMPIDGGVPKQVTFHSAFEVVNDWSPDGKKLLIASNRDMDTGRIDLYEIDVDGGTPRRITFDGGTEGSYSPDGKRVVYTRGFITIYWDNYKGAANIDLYTVPTSGGIPTRLTHTDGNERWPYFTADGKHIFFIAEEKGVANFYAMPAMKDAKRKQVTTFKGDDVHRPRISTNRKTMVFERRGQLYVRDLTNAKAKTTALKLEIKSDVRNSGIVQRTITRGGEQVHISADGRRAAFVLRGDVWTMSASGGNARRLTSGPAKDQWPRWSPSGNEIAFFSNERGNDDIFLINVRTGQKRQITKNRAGDFFHNWSPDGKSLVFCSERSGNKDIWTIELESGQLTQLTKHPAADDDPTFMPDGSGVVFDSGRSGPQAIYRMDNKGGNLRRITTGTAFYQVPCVSPDSRMVVYEAMSPVSGRSMGLFVSAIGGGPAMQLSPDGSTACWAGNGYIYFTAQRGGRRGAPGVGALYRVKEPTSVHAGERIAFIGRVEVDQRKELGDLFDEAWTALKDGFYDAKMHKVDWKKMKAKYRPIAVDAENKDEWSNVIRQMLAELGASHLGIYNTGSNGDGVTPRLVETGNLGVNFEATPLKDGGRKVVGVVPGGPADKAGIRVGDVMTRVGSKKLKPNTNLDKVLRGTAGKEITVAFKPLSGEGLGSERSQKIAPMAAMQLRSIKYKNWEKDCAAMVKEATKTKKREVVYIHLSSMNPQNLQKFQQAVAGWMKSKKIKGMVLDVRNNGGGNIHNQLMAILTSKPLARVQRRGTQAKVTQPLPVYWDKPVIVLINERSFSDAEVFPYMFKAAKRGKVVGVPTAGGVIGTNDITLSDGTRFRIPRVGFWGMDGTNLEGLGVKPDILVEETAEDRLKGRDPQLKKAIEVILVEVDAIAKAEAEKKAKAKKAKEAAEKAKKAKAKTEKKPDGKKPDEKKPDEKKPDEKKPEPEPKPTPDPKTPLAKKADEPTPVDAGPMNPLADVAVGEWVRYRVSIPGDDGKSVVKVTVSEVEGDTVKFATELEEGTMIPPLPGVLKRQGVLKMLPLFGRVLGHKIVDGNVEEISTKLLRAEVKWPDGSDIVMEFTNVIPAYGLLRVVMNGETIIEATEWSKAKNPVKVDTPAKVEPKPEVEEEKAEPETAKKADAGEADDEDGDSTMPAHPIRDAQEGEWVRIKQKMRNREMEMTVTVVEVDDEENVVFLQRTLHVPERGDIVVPQRQKMKRRKFMRRPGEARGFSDVTVEKDGGTVTVGEHELKCFTITATRNGTPIKWYYCPKVPVDGLVKVERDGETVMELVDFGTEEDE